ncbi:Hsp20 family protein [Streptomyces sp. NRRL B-1677]|nr:Hsp20 family protein [Streptomyces sp. NRRL B-1677]
MSLLCKRPMAGRRRRESRGSRPTYLSRPEEGVTAEYRDGILTVRVPQPPKKEPGARTVAVRRAD